MPKIITEILNGKAKTNKPGIPWYMQELNGTILDVVREIREEVATTGRLVREECDHAHPNKNGCSNKRVIIATSAVMGRKLELPEAWAVMIELALGITMK